MNQRWLTTLAAIAALGCGKPDSTDDSPKEAPKATVASKPAAPEIKDAAPDKQGTSGRHRQKEGSDWVPAEFKKGRAKWKESAVYVDGVPVGVLTHGELPPGMKPLWTGDDDPGDEETKRFRLIEYLEKTGVDVPKIKEIHIYGGKQHTVVISGKQARSHRDTLLFRFGLGHTGKTLVSFPNDLKMNTYFDKLTAVAVYIDKAPPTLNPDTEHVEMDGKPIMDIPYFGDPLRGGVRVYKDNRLALHLKRNKIEDADDPELVVQDGDDPTFKLMPLLAKLGVDTSDVVVAQVIRDDRREELLSKADLDSATFTALPQSSGMILLNGKLELRALALHTKPLPKATGKAPKK